MSRRRLRELAVYLVKTGKITDLREFAEMFHFANKLPRKTKGEA